MQIKKIIMGGLVSAMMLSCGFANASSTTPLTKLTGPLTSLTLKVPTKFGSLGNITITKIPVANLTAGLVPIVPGISPAVGLAIVGAANPFNHLTLAGLPIGNK